MATVRDIARIAGVSPATVSRVLRGTGNTSHEVNQKVKKVLLELGYAHASKNKLSDAASQSKTVCYMIARDPSEVFGNPYYSSVLHGLSNATQKHEINLQISASRSVEYQIEKCLSLYTSKKVDGFILSGVLSSDKSSLIQSLQNNFIPFVMIGRSLQHNIFCIHSDNFRDGYITTQHLINEGYQQILFLTGSVEIEIMRDRISGYKQALLNNGIASEDEKIVLCGSAESEIIKSLDEYVHSGGTFDAIITADSVLALAVLKYCRDREINVPNDVGIIGFNDAEFLQKISPSISCTTIHGDNLGLEALEMLIELMDDSTKINKGKTITISSELIIRQSTQRTSQSTINIE